VGICFPSLISHSLTSILISSFHSAWTNLLFPNSMLQRAFSISIDLWIKPG
jgi:hypothetical protein